MKNDESLAFATIGELAALLAKRKISPVELTDLFLRRIEKHNPALNAYLTVTAEQAMAAARRAENQLLRRGSAGAHSPLLGIPVSIKDNLWTRGIRSTAGSKILRDFIPAEDSTAVRKLLRAGAILLGKTNLNEFAYGITGGNAHYGAAHNPWDLERITGGSSAGSGAAIAAGLCVASLGTDTGGSIRVPSSFCGTVGLKPTFARVSVFGSMPLSPSLDHIGPMTRSVSDAAILLGLIAGRDPRDPTSSARPTEDFHGALRKKPLNKFRLGRPREHYWEKLDPEVRRAAENALRDMQKRGATVREVSLSHLKPSLDAATEISLAEALHVHEAAGFFPAHAADYGEEVRLRIESGAKVPAVRYLAGFDVRKRLLAEFDAAFREVDAIVAPSLPVPAPPIGAETVLIEGEEFGVRPAIVGHSRPANFTGLPAISVPCGFTRGGLPIGLQLIGRAFDEVTVLRIAASYERSNDWGTRKPSLG